MSAALSKARLSRLNDVMLGHVEHGGVPGIVAAVSRRGETHVVTAGRRSLGSDAPMKRDTIFRIASLTKPVTAAAALILVEQCKLRLDDPVDALLPELANRRVLKGLDGVLDDTVPAGRSITPRDLLTFTFGLGAVMAWPPRHPIQKAMREAGVAPDPNPPDLPAQEYMKRLGSLPLAYQPGQRWLYHTGSDVLGVLIARASGQSLGAFLQDHLFGPLGMRDTAFHVPADKLGRLASAYMTDPKDHTRLTLFDDARDSRWSKPAVFEAGSSGLVSTVDDYLAFQRMLLGKGRHGSERILSRRRRTDDERPAHAAAEGGRRAFPRRQRELGHGRCRDHASHGSLGNSGTLRLGRWLRPLGPCRSGRGLGRRADDDAHDGIAAAAARVHRLLDVRLPIHRRLTRRAS